MTSQSAFPVDYFRRQDDSDDRRFYVDARKVVHIDDHAIEKLGEVLARTLPRTGVYLDLMSSWRSHLPPSVKPTQVVGLGMNADEMADNPQLAEYVVQDLNRDPRLPFEDRQFDAVICTVSVQYLTRPVEVFTEVYRVLRPGGAFVVSFSNRCFPTKAVNIWLRMNDAQHLALVTRYFELSGAWAGLYAEQHTAPMADPLFAVSARKPMSDFDEN
jgi:SAM-dependent methyltransferase